MVEFRGSLSKQFLSILFFAILAFYCAWIYSFPVFPTQDGPVHLYYTSVIHHLLEHSELFGRYFVLKIPPPPYLLHYTILFLLTDFLPPLTAEKLVVMGCVLLFCLGMRFLLKGISEDYRLLSLFILPLSLNGMLGLGFHNYCLSLGLSFFAIGCWFRGAATPSRRPRISFLILILLMLFTHPVPLLVTLVIASGEFAARTFTKVSNDQPKNSIQTKKQDLLTLALAYCAVLYIAFFVSPSQTGQNLHHSLIQGDMLVDFFNARPLMLVAGRMRAQIYRTWLFASLVVFIAIGMAGAVRNLRQRTYTAADLFALAALAGLIVYPVVPRNMNGSDYFADRLVVYLWVMAIAGCSTHLQRLQRWLTPIALVGAAAALAVIAVDNGPLKEIARSLVRLENAAIDKPGLRGMAIEVPLNPAAPTTFAPYFWAAATYFRVTNSIMMNAPWLELTISPIAPKGDLFVDILPPNLNNFPYRILDEMQRSREFRNLLRPHLDFIVLTGSVERLARKTDNSEGQQWMHHWACEMREGYSVCRPPQ